ncbi:hypothetical protein IFR05_003501 [Cadophora sp. M221]|nr:hypothetical protein IFR05_003501 [Cadophora sp. M221]
MDILRVKIIEHKAQFNNMVPAFKAAGMAVGHAESNLLPKTRIVELKREVLMIIESMVLWSEKLLELNLRKMQIHIQQNVAGQNIFTIGQ